MLIKLWIVSTWEMLNKPTHYLIEKVCTALVERFGAVDGLWDLCHSCYYGINISRQTLVLFFFWSDKVHFPQITKPEKCSVKSGISWRGGLSLCQSSSSRTTPGWLMISPHFKAHVSFKPTMAQQRKCPKCSSTAVDGNFVVQYDVNRETTGGELEVSVSAQLGPEICDYRNCCPSANCAELHPSGNKREDELCIQLKEQRDFKWAEWIYLIYD